MKTETPKQTAAFEEYYATRNLVQASRNIGTSRQTLTKWKKTFEWTRRCEERDRGVCDQVNAVMIPQYAAVRITLIQCFLNQINEAIRAKIAPENSRDMVAISRELRALLGEGDKHEVEITGIEYILKE